ncbi:unnamed protein product [Ilex paraguariensis]|uniref:Uncharacterized protein n=1 Tax=Ilex paraguariensis TaxID=185542 RepID=A0ABC8S8W7_9AQUA
MNEHGPTGQSPMAKHGRDPIGEHHGPASWESSYGCLGEPTSLARRVGKAATLRRRGCYGGQERGALGTIRGAPMALGGMFQALSASGEMPIVLDPTGEAPVALGVTGEAPMLPSKMQLAMGASCETYSNGLRSLPLGELLWASMGELHMQDIMGEDHG